MPKAEGVHSTRAPARVPFRLIVPNPSVYLEPSPASADGGQLVGKLPSAIDAADLRGLGHLESPARAIRAKCIDCSGGEPGEARRCVFVGCPLWPFRMGTNPFRAPPSEAQRESAVRATATRMARADENQRNGRAIFSEAGLPATNPPPKPVSARASDTEDRS